MFDVTKSPARGLEGEDQHKVGRPLFATSSGNGDRFEAWLANVRCAVSCTHGCRSIFGRSTGAIASI